MDSFLSTFDYPAATSKFLLVIFWCNLNPFVPHASRPRSIFCSPCARWQAIPTERRCECRLFIQSNWSEAKLGISSAVWGLFRLRWYVGSGNGRNAYLSIANILSLLLDNCFITTMTPLNIRASSIRENCWGTIQYCLHTSQLHERTIPVG